MNDVKKLKVVNTIMAAFAAILFLMGCPDDSKNTDREKPDGLAGKLLILQAYGNGPMDGGSPGGVSHSFVELYNTTDTAINLDGIGLYYADGTSVESGSFNTATEDEPWKRISLDGKTIPAGGSLLILGKKHTNTNSTRYIIPDNYGDINNSNFILSRRAFKVALIRSTEALTVQNPFNTDGNKKRISGYIDMVGAANEYSEHGDGRDRINGFELEPARNSASEAVRRIDIKDYDDNLGDFESIRYALNGISHEMLEVRKPRNSSAGLWDPFAEPAKPIPTEGLMIFQIGAATDGNISKSFVELYNNSDNPIVLDGYSLQYAAGYSTGGTGGDPAAEQNVKDGPWKKIDLQGTILPHHSFLILGGADLEDRLTPANTVTPLDYPALSFSAGYGDMNIADFYISNRAAKVVLISNQVILGNDLLNPFTNDDDGESVTGYIDMVGVKNGGNDSIMGFETALAPSFSKQVGVRRKNLEDTNDNSYDFELITYNSLVTRTGNATSAISTYSADHTLYKPKNLAHGAWNPIKGE
jgi:hypothetical protein